MKNRIASVLIAASMGAAMLFSSMPVHAAEWTDDMFYDSDKAATWINDAVFGGNQPTTDTPVTGQGAYADAWTFYDDNEWHDPCVGTVGDSSSSASSTTQATTQESSSSQSSSQESTPATSTTVAASTSQSVAQESSAASFGSQESVSQAVSGSAASSGASTATTQSAAQTAVSGQTSQGTAATTAGASTALASGVTITDKAVLKSYPYGAMTVTAPTGMVFTDAIGADGYSFNVYSGTTLVNQALVLNKAGAPVKISSPELVNIGGKMYVNIKAVNAASVYATKEQKHAFVILNGISGFASNGVVFETFE